MRRFNPRQGLSLLEITIAAAILSVLMIAVTGQVHRESIHLSNLTTKFSAESGLRDTLAKVEDLLRFAQGVTPRATLTQELDGAENTRISIDGTEGFPPGGMAVIEPAAVDAETISYAELRESPAELRELVRGTPCAPATWHPAGSLVLWEGVAELTEDQVAPSADLFTGISREAGGNAFFRGRGTGFAFRIPVDPGGGNDFFDADGFLQWGAIVEGNVLTSGYSALYFEPTDRIDEAQALADLNRDGDQDDLFDLGRLRLCTWDAANPDQTLLDVVISRPNLLQDACDWVADVDGDGFEDPMFLWDPESGQLRVRLFALVQSGGSANVFRRETSLFLQNTMEG